MTTSKVIETVQAVRSRQSVWVEWMRDATDGLADTDLVETITNSTPWGNYLVQISQLQKVELEVPGELDTVVCVCKNTPYESGFYPCNELGEGMEPDETWNGELYCCAECGKIINQRTLQVVGEAKVILCEGACQKILDQSNFTQDPSREVCDPCFAEYVAYLDSLVSN